MGLVEVDKGRWVSPHGNGEGLPECSFCGQPSATAYWQGFGPTVLVCKQCATDTLPAFIADALAGPSGLVYRHRRQWAVFQDAVPKVLAAFWRAATLALADRLSPPGDEE